MNDQKRRLAVDLDIEAAPDTAGPFEAVEHDVVGVGREPGIGMEEKQDVAGGFVRAGVHLQRAPARRGDDAVGAQPRALDGGVAAAAVDHDDLGAERAQNRERIERRGDAFALVEHRHDDRELRHDDDLGRACARFCRQRYDELSADVGQ